MKFSYVLPDPACYRDWSEFEGDLACMKTAGYDAVELQIPDPSFLDEERLARSLEQAGYSLCALQTGSTYSSRGNCLCTADEAVRRRTVELLKSFVDLASRFGAVIVLGLLQGQLIDEPNRQAGEARIRQALREAGEYACQKEAIVAFEPVTHLEVGFHNTIAEAAALVRDLDLSSLQLMIDTFHMNIEEPDPLGPLTEIRDILSHVHLVETSRGILGTGHWPTAGFLSRLSEIGYDGYCSLGVYHTRGTRRQCIELSMESLRKASIP